MHVLKCASLKQVVPLLLCWVVVAQLYFLSFVNHVSSSDHYEAPKGATVKHNNSRKSVKNEKATTITSTPVVTDHSRFAYAFLIAGCDPNHPSYLGFLYNVLVSRYILRLKGSTADVVLLIRMKHARDSSLPAEEERWLHDSGIRVQYLPPTPEESFYSAMMAKFYILNLTDYSRVLYLDADVLPLCNLDYVFEQSQQGILKENFVVAWWGEPALGAIFMLQPGVGEYERLEEIVAKQKAKARNRWPPFDEVEGWGHKIEPHDAWIAMKRPRDTRWNFQFAFADQGLLYYWVKYEKKSVSILISRQILNFAKSSNGTVVLEETVSAPFANLSCRHFPWDKASRKGGLLHGTPLYHDFKHFTGKHKPWEKDNVDVGIPSDIEDISNATSPLQIWFHILRKVNVELKMSLDVERLSVGRPTLGRYPILAHMVPPKKSNKL